MEIHYHSTAVAWKIQLLGLHWGDSPPEVWEEALPIGNGRIGAMVFGCTDTERIQLNDDSLWPADLGWDDPYGTPEDLARIRWHSFTVTG